MVLHLLTQGATLRLRQGRQVTHPLGFRKSYGELLQVQAARLKAAIVKGEPYTPFFLRG
ncbi:hypothetical protein [Thermus amyloliquefaciens]|uniref:hypothetical protein n=1 Tax=Thermus amyloliquefaciens TaxID=1449080 RepID=UPI000B1489CE|nr:hypothetical protein [Thermus amyloliquefaciens]